MSSNNDFSLKSFFLRITALENVLIVASISQDYPMTVKKKNKEKKIKAKPYWLAYNLISAFVVSESSLKHILCTVQTTEVI